MTQYLLWMEEPEDTGWSAKFAPVKLEGITSIHRVWTLYTHVEKDKKPELPYQPQHHVNAFLEDRMHDWDFNEKTGELRYFTRAVDCSVWLLIETN